MKIPITFFAPPEREPLEIVHRQARKFKLTAVARILRSATLNYLFILNSRRQIVMASENVEELIRDRSVDQIIGLRPGEALRCVHARDCESGCGTSRACRHCGVVHAILLGLAGCRNVEACVMTTSSHGRRQLRHLHVTATPLANPSGNFTLLTVAETSRDSETRPA